MPRKIVGTLMTPTAPNVELAERLVQELKSGRDIGQPIIYEQEYSTGKRRVTVIWDAWAKMSLEARSSIILRAYEIAEGAEYLDRIALASGLTVPEAHASGMLPYQIIAAVREGDPVTPEQVRDVMLEAGASALLDLQSPQLRFATKEDAEACRQRLIERLPESKPIWVINQDPTGHEQLM